MNFPRDDATNVTFKISNHDSTIITDIKFNTSNCPTAEIDTVLSHGTDNTQKDLRKKKLLQLARIFAQEETNTDVLKEDQELVESYQTAPSNLGDRTSNTSKNAALMASVLAVLNRNEQIQIEAIQTLNKTRC